MRIRIEAIRPRKSPVIDMKIFEAEIAKALDKTAKDVEADFKKTVRTWKTNVRFFVKTEGGTLSKRAMAIVVRTDSRIYAYVTFGTRPHRIRPKTARILRFQSGYRRKTSPSFIGSRQGGAYGGFVFAPGVNHPGTQARNFHGLIAARHQPKLLANAQAAMVRAAKKSR